MADQQPIRLVREDGETIDLLAHRIEFVVDRTSSAWTTPFTDSFRAGIDLNMASIEMEVEGTFVDNKGQEKSEFATATMDFGASLPFDEPEGNGQPSDLMPPSNSRNNSNAAFADFAGIAPVVPTIPPTTEEKSRDAYFAGIHNKYFDMPVGYWYKTGEPVGSRHIRFVFDTKRSGSVQEPYAYVNKDKRATNLVIDSFSLFSRTIYVSGGDPREWFEDTGAQATAFTISDGGGLQYGAVRGVTSNSIIMYNPVPIVTVGSNIYINKSPNITHFSVEAATLPVIVIPIKHMFDEVPPAFANGSARSVGNASSPAELIAHIIANALVSDTPSTVGGVCTRPFNELGNQELSSVYSTAISTGRYLQDTLVTITQKTDVLYGALEGNISYTIPSGVSFQMTGFTGGKAGKKVKSAGDKAQDILGIVANSQNFQPNSSTPAGLPQTVIEAVEGLRGYTPDSAGDYIYGIQIPYESSVTATNSHYEQRNFFLTQGKNVRTYKKLSSYNPYPASDAFRPNDTGARKRGIKAIITDFQIEHQAQSNVYNFRMKMIASDFIL